MKVNRIATSVIKLATICLLLINSVFSAAVLSDVKSIEETTNSTSDNDTLSTVAATMSVAETSTTIDEDYDNGNASNEKASTSETLDTKPPLVFPSDESKNETALEILKKNEQKDATTEEVVSESPSTTTIAQDVDVNNSTSGSNNNDEETSQQQQKTTAESDYDSVTQEEDEKNDVENFQDENKDQGYLEEQFGFNSTSINPFEEPTLHGGHIAVIFASSLILLSILAYVGLVLWRNKLESRYGMRQRLVTEDDYYNNNDVRFFGL